MHPQSIFCSLTKYTRVDQKKGYKKQHLKTNYCVLGMFFPRVDTGGTSCFTVDMRVGSVSSQTRQSV